MDLIFPVAALLSAVMATRWSLGLGFVAICATGYFNGVIRANYMGVFTTFMFDAGLLGFYAGYLLRTGGVGMWSGRGGVYAMLLIGWPVLMSLIPVNDLLIQGVALRGTVWFIPVMLIARQFNSSDLSTVARGLAVLNLLSLAVGIYVFQNGVESLYPENAVTQIIYMSGDVAGNKHHRIPASFLSAHAYGGAMLFTLPFLLDRLFSVGISRIDRTLAAAGTVAAIAGILMCAARQPVVTFAIASVIAWVVTRFNPMFGSIAAGLLVAGGIAAVSDERLSRAASLEDTEAVSERVKGSASDSFLELIAEYPLGAGMGSSVGTSIPFFLADRAPLAVGLENEYCRILIDQGWIGLGIWVAFLIWLYARPPHLRLGKGWGIGVVLIYSLTATNWATAFIGTGTLSAIPGSVLLLAQMGVLLRLRQPRAGAPTSSSGGP